MIDQPGWAETRPAVQMWRRVSQLDLLNALWHERATPDLLHTLPLTPLITTQSCCVWLSTAGTDPIVTGSPLRLGLMTDSAPLLLQLPDPCLLAVLQCCSKDLRSLFSVARAHPRLHQAAVVALSSISRRIRHQHQVDGLLQYLSTHGQPVNSLDLVGVNCGLYLRQLPPNLQLNSLMSTNLGLQLQPWGGFQGVVRPGLPLKQLLLSDCVLMYEGDSVIYSSAAAGSELAAALALLPGLQHFSIRNMACVGLFRFPTRVFSGLQQLTYLDLAGNQLEGPDLAETALQPLTALTRLADLRLASCGPAAIHSSALSAAQQLTHLVLSATADVVLITESGALATLTRLQHLDLAVNGLSSSVGAAAGPAQLLSQLQHLQQLTHLRLELPRDSTAPAAAFSALTASSKLRILNIARCRLGATVWQHVFPANRQLPHLQHLNIAYVTDTFGCPAPAPEGSRLVSCCPGLHYLDMRSLEYSEAVLAPLQRLSVLHTLRLATDDRDGLEAVGQLTGLRELYLTAHCRVDPAEGLLLQLAQLKQLTRLKFHGLIGNSYTDCALVCQTPGDEPVWQQLLRDHLNYSDAKVAQQVAAALAE